HRFPAGTFAGVLYFELLLFPGGFDRCAVAGASALGRPAWTTGRCRVVPARLRSGDGQTVRGGYDGAVLQGERAFDRILDLLHVGEYWQLHGTLSRGLGPLANARRERFSSRRSERIPDVYRRSNLLPRASANRGAG